MSRSWGHEVFCALDQVVNAVLGGYADETISARSFRLGSKAMARGAWDQWRITWAIADWLFLWQDAWLRYRTGLWPALGHCERAYHSEMDRLQMPPEYRQQQEDAMDPVSITWPGSAEVVTISRMTNRAYDAFDEVAEFLSSRYPQHFPPYRLPGGQTQSVDQRFAWRAELGRVYDRAGVVLIARHSTGNNKIIAAAVACPTQFPHEAELVIQSTGGYAAEDIDPRMRAEMVAACQRSGLVLGRAEMVRKWVSL